MTDKTNKYGLIFDDEFKDLLPSLNTKDCRELKKSILKHGCREPLTVWEQENILVDGYHRYEICEKHGRPYEIIKIPFKNRDEAIVWIISNQIGRRNMNKFQWAEVIWKYRHIIREKAKKNQSAGGGSVHLKSDKPVNTLKALGKLAGVCPDTMNKVGSILRKLASDPKSKSLQQKVEALRKNEPGYSIHSVHKEIQKHNAIKKPKKRVIIRATRKPSEDFKKHVAKYLLSLEKDVEREFPEVKDRFCFYNTLLDWVKYQKKNPPSPPKK